MLLRDYWDALNRHDWYYQFSDDHSVWMAGLDRSDQLETVSKQSPDHKKLWEGFQAHYFSGDAWGTERAPIPERPTT